MRRGYDNGLWIENDKLIGVSLGADFTSEHEWGIKGIRRKFGMSDEGLGIERRLIRELPQNMKYMSDDNNSYIFCYSGFWRDENLESVLKGIGQEVLPIQNKSGIGSAWDEGTFGIAFGPETRKYKPDLRDAIQSKDLMIGFTGNDGPFSNPGLFLGIVSRLPKEWIQQMYDIDYDHQLRHEHPDHLRITQVLKDAGKRYFALSPKWADTREKKELQWWLNPMEQQTNNYGWFKINDLEQWAKGKGPIPKEA